MGTTADIRKGVDEALDDLEQLAEKVRVKIHLAGMDARDAWEKLEPRLEDARRHAQEATAASKMAIDETVKAIRDFSKAM